MRRIFLLVAAMLLALPAWPEASFADQTGFASMHNHGRYRGRLCFTDHSHVGNGGTERTKRHAIRSAARDWAGFTAWEYGTDWARWRIARAKKVDCTKSDAGWSCSVEAYPCLARSRKASRAKKRRRRN